MAERSCATCLCYTAPKPPPAGVDLAAAGIQNLGRCRRYPKPELKAPDDFCFECRPIPAAKTRGK